MYIYVPDRQSASMILKDVVLHLLHLVMLVDMDVPVVQSGSMSGGPPGSGGSQAPAGLSGGQGLCEGLPHLHLRLHLQQLCAALQLSVPAYTPTGQ